MGGTHLFKVINEVHIFFSRFLFFVVFGNGLTDKHSLVFGTAFTRNHLAATVYFSYSLLSGFDVTFVPAAPDLELTDFYCSTAKPLQHMEKSNLI